MPVLAQDEGNPPNWCRNGHFPRYGNFGIGYVKGKKNQKTYFYNDENKCPTAKGCRRWARYVVPGDQVITSKSYKGFTCVWYQTANRPEMVGWVPTRNLEFPLYVPSLYGPWPGDWKYERNVLSISKTNEEDTFEVKGMAFWFGMGDNIHTGEIDTKGVVTKEGTMTLKDDLCEIKLDTILDDYLIVSDNLKCGGANVTFTGVYRKMRKE